MFDKSDYSFEISRPFTPELGDPGRRRAAKTVPDWFLKEVRNDHKNEMKLLVRQVAIVALLAAFVVLRSLLLT